MASERKYGEKNYVPDHIRETPGVGFDTRHVDSNEAAVSLKMIELPKRLKPGAGSVASSKARYYLGDGR